MRETQLYPPVKTFLAAQGFKVCGEVHGCDMAATRGGELVVVELKLAFNLDLVLQGIQRQTLTDQVYLAVPVAGRSRREYVRWRKVVRLCRLLGLGLLTVGGGGKSARVEPALEPKPYKPRKNAAKRRSLLAEFNNRSADYNVGGCCRRKIVTAYREEALRIANHLKLNGPTRVNALSVSAQSRKCGSILLHNYYGWFERESRGVYRLTPKGDAELRAYANVLRGA